MQRYFIRMPTYSEIEIALLSRLRATAQKNNKRVGDVVRDIMCHVVYGTERNDQWIGYEDKVTKQYMLIEVDHNIWAYSKHKPINDILAECNEREDIQCLH